VFESLAARGGASTRLAIIRLNYAIDLRYGVLVDLACRILDGTPIDLAMGHVNVIWQGDANRIAIEALRHAAAPPFAINVTGTETLRVRDLAAALGARLGREPILTGTESSDALLSNASRMAATFGAPETSLDWMLDATASWLSTGGPLLGKETRFEVRDGKF
jgi:nucleoside-diphosphate-sugar epimerase